MADRSSRPQNRLLIVDDEAKIGEFVGRVARALGYAVEAISGADEFLLQLAEFEPTHIMLDLSMPRTDGIELMRHLAAEKSQVQIVIASGAGGTIVDTARRLGVEQGLRIVRTLLKPVRAAELRETLLGLKIEDWPSEVALAAAIDADQIVLHYQPKIDLRDNRLAGYEALVRWEDPAHGRVPPDQFVPLAEKTGLIDRLTRRIVELALAQAHRWSRQPGAPAVAINISGRNLHDVEFPDWLTEQCTRTDIPPSQVVLEITETAAMADPTKAMDIFTRLRLKGFGLSLDDFGTGYSSLAQLARMPFTEVKIDQSFIRDCTVSRQSAAIVKSMADMARNLDLHSVAEGVETAELHEVVAGLGCDMVQGFHIARPMPASAVEAWAAGWAGLKTAATLVPSPRKSNGGLLWTKAYDGSDDQRLALEELLCRHVNPLWNLGRNSLLGWRPSGQGIDVLVVPYGEIMDRFAESRRLLHGRRLMGQATFESATRLVGATPEHIPLPFPVADGEPGAVPTTDIERVLQRYSIMETLHRGVGLFDIVGFSKYPPMVQVAQLNSLECSINRAHKLMHDAGRKIDLARTSTGDGFYVWNREKGSDADLNTYLLMLFSLADNALLRQSNPDGRVPNVRMCFLVGPHYSYHQIDGLDPRGHDYIVGDVTIRLARMAEKCLPGQILIGNFQRPAEDDGGTTNPIEFVVSAQALLDNLGSAKVNDREVDAIKCYFTGPRTKSDEFLVSLYTISDKHGFSHEVFNQKFNVHLRPDGLETGKSTVYLGLRQSELGEFDAQADDVVVNPQSPGGVVLRDVPRPDPANQRPATTRPTRQ